MIHTEIQINAPPSAVREAFLDFPSLPTYHTTFIKTITPHDPSKNGPTLSPGDKLSCLIGNMSFSTVVETNSPAEFTWRGTLGSTAFFTGAHHFKFLAVHSDGDGDGDGDCDGGAEEKTRFVHGEEFGGVLAGVFGLFGREGTKRGFERINEDLKTFVEGKYGR
ncbi:hypothetical protein FQN54_001768 [Arachnomyces sp. PD_36]|nr:hypothetical protein FQN54_001768 [Arachnomyces sp. PD_36]